MICKYVCIICSPDAWAVPSSILKQTCSQPGLLYHNTSVENIFFLIEFLPAIKILLSTFSGIFFFIDFKRRHCQWIGIWLFEIETFDLLSTAGFLDIGHDSHDNALYDFDSEWATENCDGTSSHFIDSISLHSVACDNISWCRIYLTKSFIASVHSSRLDCVTSW